VQFDFNGTWPKKKNWALEHLPFKNDWVFILDADEVMPAGAGEEFSTIIANDGYGKVGFWINRRFMFMGKWLRHAYYPNWNLRLFKHALGRYEKITEAATESGDNEVHEHVVVEGETGRLRSEMLHYAFPSVATFIEKHNRYSNWEARVSLEKLTSSKHLQAGEISMRRRIKQVVSHLPFRPFLRFCFVYIFQRGFLDGIEGYYFARLHGVYELLNVIKTKELLKHAEGSQESDE
jgi:hypothetical protein